MGRPAPPENAGLFVGAGLVVANEQTASRASAAKRIRSFIRISLGKGLSPRSGELKLSFQEIEEPYSALRAARGTFPLSFGAISDMD
jgi:hypothetical protein